MCLSDTNFSRRVAFIMLEDLQHKFLERYSEVVNTVIAFGMHAEFGAVIKERMNFYNTDANADKLQTLQHSIDGVKNVMIDNIDKLLARGEKVELLVKKTEVMSEQAVSMKKRASLVRRKMWM